MWSRLEKGDFLRLRLLDLDDHVGRLENVGFGGEDGRAGFLVGQVRAIDALACVRFDEQLVARTNQFRDRRGVRPTRNSLFLISFGTPIRIVHSLQCWYCAAPIDGK